MDKETKTALRNHKQYIYFKVANALLSSSF